MKCQIKKVTISDLGEIYIREFSGRDRNSLVRLVQDDDSYIVEKYCMVGWCKEDGSRVWNNDQLLDVADLPARITKQIYEEICILNALRDTDIDLEKKV